MMINHIIPKKNCMANSNDFTNCNPTLSTLQCGVYYFLQPDIAILLSFSKDILLHHNHHNHHPHNLHHPSAFYK